MKRVVVTGMGVISPVGNTVASYFDALLAGMCGIGPITAFDTADHKVSLAAEVKDFDATAFMEKNDIRKTDLYAQYAIAAAVQAMDDAAICPGDINPERLGVYMGSGIGGISTFFTESKKLVEKGPKWISPHFIPMMIANMAAGLISIRFDARGPSLPIVTACASSTNTIGEAYRAIRHGYADAILAGGSEAAIHPIAIAGFANSMALSTTSDPASASIPFDNRRNGFVLGAGAGALLLEEYEHAKKRGATIYAEVTGYGNTADAYHVTAPQPEALSSSKAISLAVAEAGIRDFDKLYINAHGTSTPLNDKIETEAIKRALGDGARRCCISSTKSMTGHMLGAAGAAEAIAAILALASSKIPPTIGYAEPDPACDLDYVPNVYREAPITAALSTSFGFGGHNACICFEKIDS